MLLSDVSKYSTRSAHISLRIQLQYIIVFCINNTLGSQLYRDPQLLRELHYNKCIRDDAKSPRSPSSAAT